MTRYTAPRTTAEAVELLASRPGARMVAGGTDLSSRRAAEDTRCPGR